MEENKNPAIYNKLWQQLEVIELDFGPSWEIIREFQEKAILEIGPGHLPRIPIKQGYFIDSSRVAVEQLRLLGGQVLYEDGSCVINQLPKEFFDLVVAWDVLEHIPNDLQALQAINRILKKDGYFLVAVPIRMLYFGASDSHNGHYRRYEPEELIKKFTEAGFKIVKWREGGFLSWLYSFAFMRSQARRPVLLVDNFPGFLIKIAIKLSVWFEKLTHGKWQTKPMASINKNKRLTRLEILYKKCD